MAKGIDVSENNGQVDWQAVADAGYTFAMVRSSYGKSHKDEMFLENVNGAHAAGLKVGAYHYSYSLTTKDAIAEAANCKSAIEEAGVFLELPVFFDMEDADHWKAEHGFSFDPVLVTMICRVFLGNIGLDCGVYASLDWLDGKIDWQALGVAVWNAEWGNEDSIKGYMWQYTDKAVIGDKQFDANEIYMEV